MAQAVRLGVEAGRAAFQAGRIPRKAQASPSSPTTGLANVKG
jgi:thiazole synthase